jgi:hypothetical protein
VQLDQLIQPLQTRCPSAFGAEYRLRVSAISIYCRTEGNCDGSSGTPTGTEGATPAERCAAEEGRQKVEPVRSGALMRMPDFGASRPMLPSWPDDRLPPRTAGCRVASEPLKTTPSSHPSLAQARAGDAAYPSFPPLEAKDHWGIVDRTYVSCPAKFVGQQAALSLHRVVQSRAFVGIGSKAGFKQ